MLPVYGSEGVLILYLSLAQLFFLKHKSDNVVQWVRNLFANPTCFLF